MNWGTKREEKRIKWIIADGNEWPFDYYDCAHARLPIHASFAIIRSLHPGFDGSFREKETDLNISRVPVEIQRSLAASNFFLVSRKNRTSPFFLGRYTWSFETVSSSSSSVRLLLEPRDSVALLNFSMSFSPDYRALLSVSSFLFPVQLVKRAKRNSPLFDGYPIKHRKLMPGISRASDVFQQGKK